MTVEGSPILISRVHRLCEGQTVVAQSERQLLDRFVAGRDPQAFEALVVRHGPMVLGVCRAVLPDPTDADDAFQATFLLLVRKAGSLRDRDQLGPWLHGVARRVARRARANAARRFGRETPSTDLAATAAARSTRPVEERERSALLHAELDRLSLPERSAILLCDLEGLSHQEAADQLGWPLGTVKSRVARGRDRLRSRLVRRGVTLSASALASSLAGEAVASPAIARPLIIATTRAALAVAAGQTLTVGLVSAPVLSLTQGAARAMIITKLKIFALSIAATSAALAVPGVLAYQQVGRPAAVGAGQPAAQDVASRQPDRVAVLVQTPEPTRPRPTTAAVSVPAREPAAEIPFAAEHDELMKKLDGPNYLKKAWFNALENSRNGMSGGNRTTSFREMTDQLMAIFPQPGVRLGIRSVFSDEAYMIASQPYNPQVVLDAAEPVSLRVALETAARAVGLQFRVVGDDLFFDVIESQPQTNAAAPPTVISKPAAPPATRPQPTAAASPAATAAPTSPATEIEAKNLAILKKLEEPNPLSSPLARFMGGSASASVAAPPFAGVMEIVTEATVDPAAGLPQGIPIRFTAVGKRLADSISYGTPTVEGFVRGPNSTPLRVILAAEAARYGLDYRVDDGAMIFDESKVATPDRIAVRADVRQRNADDDQRNVAIRTKLDRVIPLRYPNKVSLNELVAYIKSATREGNEKPIPVYVDPRINAGETKMDPTEPAITIDLDDVPLRTSLRLALLQIRLEYAISGGLLIIGTSDRSNQGGMMGGGMGSSPPSGIGELVDPRDRTFGGMGGGFR